MPLHQDYTDKFFLKNLFSFTVYVLNPRFLIIMAVLIGLGSLFIFIPFVTIFLNLLVMAVSFKFAVDILLTTAAGSFEPDEVSFSENEYVIVIQIIAVGIILNYLTDYAISVNNNALTYFVIYAIQFIMPAIYMVLAYSGSIIEALNPVTLIRFIKPWFFTYAVFSLFYVLTIYLETQGILALIYNFVSIKVFYFLSAFLMLFFLFLNFHIMGFLIFQNFNQVEENVDDNFNDLNETNSKDNQPDSSVYDNPIYSRIQNLIESETTTEALAIINELQKDGDKSAELEAYKNQISKILENKVKVPLNQQIHTLIEQRKITTAFKIFEKMHLDKTPYVEVSESDLGMLAQHAFNSEKYTLVIKLLNGFNKKYPTSNDIVPNFYLIAQVLYKNPKTKSKALIILKGLIKKYPNHALNNELKSWAKGIELMDKK